MHKLTLLERKKIENFLSLQKLSKKLSIRSISRILCRSHSSILDEIKKNTKHGQKYNAEEAERRAISARQKQRNKNKLDTNINLQNFVIQHLSTLQCSPEQISQRLKKLQLHNEIGSISHEAIYTWIYSDHNKHKQLWKHLRRHRKKRYPHYGRKKHKTSAIKNRVSIHSRPQYINDISRFGDWETDSVIFSKQKQILSVQVERFTKLVRIHICEDKSAQNTYEAIIKTIETLPPYSMKTLTFDNGTENVKHTLLNDEYNIKTYFCDPYSSWQKGLVENTNMLLRQYLPRHIKISQLSHQDILDIQEKLNNRPRKSLNYLTPNEKLSILIQSGRITP